MSNSSLDEWFGKQVAIQLTPSRVEEQQTNMGCTLESADERGVLISYHEAEDLKQRFYFLPWHRVEWIYRWTD